MSSTKDQTEVDEPESPETESAPRSSHCSPPSYGAESMVIFTMHDDERREALRLLRETYHSAIKLESEATRRSAEVMMCALTEPLSDHTEFFGAEDEWEHPCLCYECRTCG